MWEEVNTVTFAEKLREVMKEQNISHIFIDILFHFFYYITTGHSISKY